MSAVLVLLLKALAGGALVVAFSLVSEMVHPKSFAGIFSAAPSIALASLAIIVVTKGAHEATLQAGGMVIGAVAMVFCCLVGIDAIKRLRALRGSAAAVAAWLVVAIGTGAVLLR